MNKYLFHIFLVIFCLLSGSIVKAEPYKSKSFPSNNIIKQAYNQSGRADNPYKIVQLLGKLKSSDGVYHIFFTSQFRDHRPEVCEKPIKLYQLDTEIWIFDSPKTSQNIILQK